MYVLHFTKGIVLTRSVHVLCGCGLSIITGKYFKVFQNTIESQKDSIFDTSKTEAHFKKVNALLARIPSPHLITDCNKVYDVTVII